MGTAFQAPFDVSLKGDAMMLHGTCKTCQGKMAVLDILMEGYDLICTRCGQREIIHNGLTQPPPCYH